MFNKILGALIILAIACGAIFIVKFLPIYMAVGELKTNFEQCISQYDTWHEGGCRSLFEETIKKNHLHLNASDIYINCKIFTDSVVSADIDEEIDFWGVWKYRYTKHLEARGKPPKRD